MVVEEYWPDETRGDACLNNAQLTWISDDGQPFKLYTYFLLDFFTSTNDCSTWYSKVLNCTMEHKNQTYRLAGNKLHDGMSYMSKTIDSNFVVVFKKNSAKKYFLTHHASIVTQFKHMSQVFTSFNVIKISWSWQHNTRYVKFSQPKNVSTKVCKHLWIHPVSRLLKSVMNRHKTR